MGRTGGGGGGGGALSQAVTRTEYHRVAATLGLLAVGQPSPRKNPRQETCRGVYRMIAVSVNSYIPAELG